MTYLHKKEMHLIWNILGFSLLYFYEYLSLFWNRIESRWYPFSWCLDKNKNESHTDVIPHWSDSQHNN